VVKYKSQYKANYQTANTLAGNRTYAMKHDANLQVATKGTRSWSNPVSYRTRMTSSKYPMVSSRHVKTTMTGTRGVVGSTWADGRSKYSGTSRMLAQCGAVQGQGSAGRSAMQRGGYSRSGTMPYGSGTTRMKSGYSGSNGARGTWSPSHNGNGRSGYSSGYSSGGVMRGYGGSQGGTSYKGWSGGSWGGSRGGFSGGAMRGGFSGGGHGGGGGKGR
jgi:hypothetical protein